MYDLCWSVCLWTQDAWLMVYYVVADLRCLSYAVLCAYGLKLYDLCCAMCSWTSGVCLILCCVLVDILTYAVLYAC